VTASAAGEGAAATIASKVRQAQLEVLTQGMGAMSIPVVVVDSQRAVLLANDAFKGAFPAELGSEIISDAWTRLSDPGTTGPPRDGEVAVRGSRRVRVQGLELAPGSIEWFILVVERRAARRLTADNVQHRFGLSPRQAEVALLLAQGHTTAEIARMLELTTHTVRHHAEQVLRRLSVRTRQQAMVKLRDGTARGPKARPSGGHSRP
jgi:DNA-binding CsgD family transcriptional regulator